MKLQNRHEDLLCSHKKLINLYALIEATHEVMLTMVKFSQPHTCTCEPHSIDLSCDEYVHVKTCDSLIAIENDELKWEIEMLKMELSRLKRKGQVQPSQDNHDHKVKKLENGSTVTYAKLPQINLKKPY
jgi:hypothetical protein